MFMFNGNVGSVGGNGNDAWYKQLAKILDKADGIEDNKIGADIWNGFLKPGEKSNANGIKRFINLNRAEISFNYYKNTKDVGNDKVDWSNWKQMLNVYLEEIGKDDLKVEVEESTVNPQGGQNDPQAQDAARQAEFNDVMNQSKLKDLKKFGAEELPNLIEGFESIDIPDDAPDGAELYENPQTGERIAISPNPDGQTGLLVFQKDGLTHKITFDKSSGELKSGEITTKQADGTEKTYNYTYNENGEAVLDAATTPDSVDLRPLAAGLLENLDDSTTYTLESDENGVKTYKNVNGSETITVKTNTDGTSTITVAQINPVKNFSYEVDVNGVIISETEVIDDNGKNIEIKRTHNVDGSTIKEVTIDGQPVDDYDDGGRATIGEFRLLIKNSPLNKDAMPTEAELTAAGYTKIEDVMTGNGGIFYQNASTGESIMVSESDKTCIYKKGFFEQTQYYDNEGKPSGGRLVRSSETSGFTTAVYEKDSATGEMQIGMRKSQASFESFPKSYILYANEAIIGHTANIKEFTDALGLPELDFKKSLENINMTATTGEASGEMLSDDGNVKTVLYIDQNGNVKITYSRKQPDGSFKEVGSIELQKQAAPGTLRKFDYEFKSRNAETAEEIIKSSASWDDFA